MLASTVTIPKAKTAGACFSMENLLKKKKQSKKVRIVVVVKLIHTFLVTFYTNLK